MHFRRLIFILFTLLLLASPCMAGIKVTVHPTGGDADQKVINDAFEKVAKFGGGEVYLEGEDGNNVFTVTGTCKFQSDNTKLTGDSNVILAVSPDSSQWFTGTNTIIYSGGYNNIEISGFQIDGNCEKLPFEYHHSRFDTAHDCERAILIAGQSGKFCSDISVNNMKIYDCLSDGVHVRFANRVHVYNNFISNCQHEGIFFVSVIEGLTEKVEVFGITSDCTRYDNCVDILVQDSYFTSYKGDKNSKAPKGENNGMQIADAGASHGYDASKKPTSTKNIEVKNCTFSNIGSKAIWLDSTGKGYENVYLHDNEFLNVKVVNNPGESVKVNIEPTTEDKQIFTDLTETVTPSTEMSEKIFSSIFDYFSESMYTQAGKNEYVVLPKGVTSTPSKETWTIEQQESCTLIYGSIDGLSEVQYNINGKQETHTIMLGEKTGNKMVFSNCSIWKGDFKHQGNALYIEGNIDPENIKVTCISPTYSFTPKLKLENIDNPKSFFHPILKYFFLIIFGALGFIYLQLKFTF